MKNKSLNNIQSTGFKTPPNYFESLDNTIFSKLDADNHLGDISASGFKVPDTYFESFDDTILNALKIEDDAKVIPLYSWKKVAYISGIAASIVLAFNLLFNQSNTVTFDNLETASIEDYLIGEDLSAYDIAPYLNPLDMNSDNFVENTINDLTLEDYLLQNSDVEHLITD